MVEKGQAEKQEEATQFAAYKQFCDDTSASKRQSIQDGNAAIEMLQAEIQKAESDSRQLAARIAELDELIAGFEGDKKASTEVREKEHAAYKKTHVDYTESIDSLHRAIQTLQSQGLPNGALLQVTKMARVPQRVKRVITNFLATDDEVKDPLSVTAPEARVFEFSMGSIVDMLKQLDDKFSDERDRLEKEEMNGKHAFEMMMQDLTGEITSASRELGRAASAKAGRDEAAAEGKGDLADTTHTRDEDDEYLSKLLAQCSQKSQDFSARQQLRTEELEAVGKAIEILKGDNVSGTAGKYLPSMVQTSFALLRSDRISPLQKSVAQFLQGRAGKLDSRVLERVASKVAEDPFKKVRKMIKDLIVKLMEEANEEAEHKGWCDSELATNKVTRDRKTGDVERLTAAKDQLQADVALLGEQIRELSSAIAASDAAVAKATAQRTDESAENKRTVADARAAATAVNQAIAVLRQFYATAAESTSLLQQPEVDAPETFNEPYRGMGGESGGVLGMLEVIQSDFARLESETAAAEDEASAAFDTFCAESSKDRAVKATQVDHKEQTKTKKSGDLNEGIKDLKATQDELDAAVEYFDKLKPSCVDSGTSYGDRVKRRQEEIESLQEALRIMEGEDIA